MDVVPTPYIRQFYIKDITGCYIGGTISKWLDLRLFLPLHLEFKKVAGRFRLEFVFEYYGIRYHLLLKENSEVRQSTENLLLEELTSKLKNGRDYIDAQWKCLDIFWRTVALDSEQRMDKSEDPPSLDHRFEVKNTVNLQIYTQKDGVLRTLLHDEPRLYPLSEPIVNPCPLSVPLISMDELKFEREVWSNVFKAKKGDRSVCVKVAPADDLLSELKALIRMPKHPYLNYSLLGVVKAKGGLIDKFVVQFIEGKQLARLKEASLDQKEKWKYQIRSGIAALHANGLSWGDVAQRNVIIEANRDQAILIDFAYSILDGDVSFADAKKRDLSSLNNLNSWIDNLKST